MLRFAHHTQMICIYVYIFWINLWSMDELIELEYWNIRSGLIRCGLCIYRNLEQDVGRYIRFNLNGRVRLFQRDIRTSSFCILIWTSQRMVRVNVKGFSSFKVLIRSKSIPALARWSIIQNHFQFFYSKRGRRKARMENKLFGMKFTSSSHMGWTLGHEEEEDR